MSDKLKIKAYIKPDNTWQFQVFASNGEALTTSESYVNRADMMRAIFLLTNVGIEEGITMTENPNHEDI